MLRKLALIQGLFYLVTVVGLVLIFAWRRRQVSEEVIVLAVGCALGLAGIDIVYSLSGRISAVYLADAGVELGLATLWGWARLSH